MKKLASQTLLHARAMADVKNPRLQPPPGTPDAQCLVWHQTVDSLPSSWFAHEQIPLLVAYTNHVCRLAKIEDALAGLDPVADLEVYDKLSKLAAGESAKVLAHARSMRLTQQSRLKAETASGHATAAAGAASAAGAFDDDFDGLLA